MLVIKAKTRIVFGKKSKTLQKSGLIPAVVYGGTEKPQPLEIDLKDFQKTWEEAGESSLIELDFDGQKKNVLIKDIQRDSINGLPIHVDFYAVRMDKPIQAMVSITFIGESPAVKNLGGSLVKVMHEIEIEALPKDLPHELEVDISGLVAFNDRFLIKDLKLPAGVKVLAGSEDVMALVEEPKAEEEAPSEAPTLEGIEVVDKKGKKEEIAEEAAVEEKSGTKAGPPVKAKEEKRAKEAK
ncbi:MAG: 50S ribosomal protein L25 [Candidatus Niyogibacteria bacterium]|nr:MAG: 50S ribosomal protein L25 [Candidatus Niyogibacteria bacterium]